MRYVVNTDDEGYKRRYLVRDTDSDVDARAGIPAGPPDLDVIDWHALKREINNRLADAEIFDIDALLRSPQGLNLLTAIIKQWVVGALKSDKAAMKHVDKQLTSRRTS